MSLAPLSQNTLHVVIDIQRIFAEETVWHTPVIAEIVPNVISLCEALPDKTLFAKFMLPQSAETASGRWKTYYERWSAMTLDAMPAEMQDVIEPLKRFANGENEFEKFTYSAFGSSWFVAYLKDQVIDTIIFSGVETDVCVYASVLDAVDAGYRVVIAADAVGSSDMAAHHATMTHLAPRLSDQVDIVSTASIVNAWTEGRRER